MQFASVRVNTGIHLHYVDAGSAGSEEAVLLHGWPDSWFTFSRILPLVPTEYRVLAFDQRGFGDSERPSSGYRIESFADDVAAFCDALSLQRVTLVGHSFGTFVARRVAVAHPERVRRLVLIGSGFAASNPVTRDIQASIRDLPDSVPTEFVREFQASTAHLPVPGPFFDRIVAESSKATGSVWRASFDGLLAFEDTERLRDIAVPTLLIWGDRDALFSRDDQERLLSTIPHATLRVYTETGHCPNWERPEQVAADLVDFMKN